MSAHTEIRQLRVAPPHPCVIADAHTASSLLLRCFLHQAASISRHMLFYLVVLGRVAHIEERLGLRALKGDLVDLLEERELGLDTLRLERLHHVLRGARALCQSKQQAIM